jgi:glyceraldehyde-3-phosphate dehydrogenase/erythrose-4-phosphate dehydrogenase
MKVLVNGLGNIGSTLVNLLQHYQAWLGISVIYANKNTPQPWQAAELDYLRARGVVLCSPTGAAGFTALDAVLPQVDYIFETGANGVGMRNLARYAGLPGLQGCAAQGSEKGFGTPFMSGVNDALITGQKFVQVVSCNTHGTAALLGSLAGWRLENLDWADMVVVRRSEDLGNHERLVSANVVARHLDPVIGTHHALDVCDMFATLQVPCELTSSDITTPSQLMHAVRFHIRLKQALTPEAIAEKISQNAFLAQTQKFDSNVIFELGRRYGFNGRIFSHAIVVAHNLIVNGPSIKGWAFVPQEGNTIISSLHAMLLQMQVGSADTLLENIKCDLLRQHW